jgi:hypothetical protein
VESGECAGSGVLLVAGEEMPYECGERRGRKGYCRTVLTVNKNSKFPL